MLSVPLSRRLARPPLTIGLRREDLSRIWERRCPLTPDAVHDLVHNENVNVIVQNCERRVFPNNEFVKVFLHFFSWHIHIYSSMYLNTRPVLSFAKTLAQRT